MTTIDERRRLGEWLRDRLGWSDGAVEFERIGEGHSREMLVARPNSERPVVVRVEQGGVFGTATDEEFAVMTALGRHGVPVAPIVARGDPSVIGRDFFVMEFVEGSDTPPPIDAFVDELDRLHRLPLDDDVVSSFERRPIDAADATRGQIERWYSVLRTSMEVEVPTLEKARRRLVDEVPSDGRLAVVHGDAGPGNFLHDGERVLALTDWEFAHLGDPREDWVFCIAIRGPRVMDRESWLRVVAERTGTVVDAASFRYWEVFNYFKGACANASCRRLYALGVEPAPNLAIVGTAIHRLFVRRLDSLLGRT